MKEKSQIDILIPVFNENEIIVKTLENILESVKYNFKILICYDYDEDPTIKIIKENFKDYKNILFVRNFSKGFNNALISGLRVSKANTFIFFMADDHVNHSLINLCYKKYEEGYEVVCPSRFIKGGKMIGNPFLKPEFSNTC